MSYTIIFETKIVILPDGRILHLSLQGCNNDTAGRSRNDFRGSIYNTYDEFEKFIRSFEESPHVELKIGRRFCTFADYAKHLRRMLKKACSWDELKIDRPECYAKALTEVEFYSDGEDSPIRFTPKEWEKVWAEYLYRGGKTVYHRSFLYEIEEIVKAMDNGETLEFTIERRHL